MVMEGLKVHGAYKFTQERFADKRGLFMEVGRFLGNEFRQINFSQSKKGVIRGMHVQKHAPQAKYVMCLSGKLMDVVHDLRASSPTFGVTDNRILTPGSGLFCPAGTAHGFQCLSEACEIIYLCSTLYVKEWDAGFKYSDANAPWLSAGTILSDKDSKLPSLAKLLRRNEWQMV